MILYPTRTCPWFLCNFPNCDMHYKVSSQHAQSHDTGILWNSAGINWPDDNPVLSARDKNFLALNELNHPLVLK